MGEQIAIAAIFFGVSSIYIAALAATKKIADEKGKEITEKGGVFKSKGKFYAYCPKCGRKCGQPQIIPVDNRINNCLFRCYQCNKNFEKKYDRFILKG